MNKAAARYPEIDTWYARHIRWANDMLLWADQSRRLGFHKVADGWLVKRDIALANAIGFASR